MLDIRAGWRKSWLRAARGRREKPGPAPPFVDVLVHAQDSGLVGVVLRPVLADGERIGDVHPGAVALGPVHLEGADVGDGAPVLQKDVDVESGAVPVLFERPALLLRKIGNDVLRYRAPTGHDHVPSAHAPTFAILAHVVDVDDLSLLLNPRHHRGKPQPHAVLASVQLLAAEPAVEDALHGVLAGDGVRQDPLEKLASDGVVPVGIAVHGLVAVLEYPAPFVEALAPHPAEAGTDGVALERGGGIAAEADEVGP